MAEIIPKETDRDGVRLLMRRGGQLVDVLPREEYDLIHLAGAISIPLSIIGRNTADRLKWDRPVVVYSRDAQCDLSARAAWRLASLGFTQVYRYTDGRADWLANGQPVEGANAQITAVADLADMDMPTCKRSEKVGEVRKRVRDAGWNTCVVVNDQLVVLGLLRGSDLDNANQNWPAEDAMERDPMAYRLDASPAVAAEYMERNRLDSVLVTTTDGKLFGVFKREDVDKAS